MFVLYNQPWSLMAVTEVCWTRQTTYAIRITVLLRHVKTLLLPAANLTLNSSLYRSNLSLVLSHLGRNVGGVAQWLERRYMTGELSLACAMTCS